MKKWIVYIICLVHSLTANAHWTAFFAYNNVSKIAVTQDKVYALSDGSLFTVDKVSEKIESAGAMSGLRGTQVSCIYYDEPSDKLLIAYASGKIDVISKSGIDYVSGFYTKDITDDKIVHNMTVHDGRVYLATPFGIVTFSLRRQELVDAFYIGVNASKVDVQDVAIYGDSIYAYTSNQAYRACLQDNMVDYRVWQALSLSESRPRDTKKGVIVTDKSGDIWQAGNEKGVIRTFPTGETMNYKPSGPYENTPYRMMVHAGRLYVVPGGRWATQNMHAGLIMLYDRNQWSLISQSQIHSVTNNPVYDFMNVAVDPNDEQHYFVTSYGTGLYEFKNDQCVAQYLPKNSILTSAVETKPTYYTRCDGAVYDAKGNLYVVNAGVTTHSVVVRTKDGEWGGMNVTIDGAVVVLSTPIAAIVDNRNPNRIWTGNCRSNTGIAVIDNGGTLLDETDDKAVYRNTFIDQNGTVVTPTYIYTIKQMSDGSVWLGTTEGVIILPSDEDIFASANCLRISLRDGTESVFQTEEVQTIEEGNNEIYVGTNLKGVYALSKDVTSIRNHYTIDNSILPSNSILSLACDRENEILYIGTSNGIVAQSEMPLALPTTPTTDETEWEYGSMKQWHSHKSYAQIDQIEIGNKDVYAIADGSLMSIGKQDEQITYWDKTNGLHGDRIRCFAFDKKTKQLIVVYTDGLIDFISESGDVAGMPDLYKSMVTNPTQINSITQGEKYTYIALNMGILSINPTKKEISDTYIIGANGSNVNVKKVVETEDSIYAATDDCLYVVAKNANLVDYQSWHAASWSMSGTLTDIEVLDNQIYVLINQQLYRKTGDTWEGVLPDYSFAWIRVESGKLMARDAHSNILTIDAKMQVSILRKSYDVTDISYDLKVQTYWMASPSIGVIRLNESEQWFTGVGPLSNDAMQLRFAGEDLYVCPGGKWASQYFRAGDISIYKANNWQGCSAWQTSTQTGIYPLDFTSIAVDPKDHSHFYASSYGLGVFEFKNYVAVRQYTEGTQGCTLKSSIENNNLFVRVDGAIFDSAGNLWVVNAGDRAKAVNILSPQGKWYAYDIMASLNGGSPQRITFSTPGLILVDALRPNYKWMYDMRSTAGVILLDDNGTPLQSEDDRSCKRSAFIDQDGKPVSIATCYCMTQDLNGDIWVGTQSGLFIIQKETDFFRSNVCHRIIIPRNDGTNLADYLLDNEQINAIVSDGGNRKWIGTANSGLYLVSADGLTTIAHFTPSNSLLPSNDVLSIAINPVSGEVFVGTANGIVSYQSDASEGREDLSNVLVYPNPVRPNYIGEISITGLMDNTIVNIIDAGGNLICKTRSNGGTAVWDGKDMSGRRASTGVYTALCNTADGTNHTAIKILFIH